MLDYEELMEYEKRMKPEQKKRKISIQHQQWLEVMLKQVDENFARHVAQLKRSGREPLRSRPDSVK